jgi:hypothetical protein
MKDIYKYIRYPKYVSMYWDIKDLLPSIRYRLSFLKALIKAVMKKKFAHAKEGVK